MKRFASHQRLLGVEDFNMPRPLIARLSLLAVGLLLLSASGAVAQSKKKGEDQGLRAVQGTVSDANGNAVEGAVVQLKNTKTLQIHSFITKEHGAYFFQGLNPDVDYQLKAEYQGALSATRTLSSFDSRKQAVINLKLEKK